MSTLTMSTVDVVRREDLLQVATVGLIVAIERLDPSRGTAFTSFAVPTMAAAPRRATTRSATTENRSATSSCLSQSHVERLLRDSLGAPRAHVEPATARL